MAADTFEETVSRYASAILPETHQDGAREVKSDGVNAPSPMITQRRGEVRWTCQQECLYQLLEVTAEDAGRVEEGEAFVLNRSAGGVLLIMGRPLTERQLVEVDVENSRWSRSASVYEVRWVKTVPIESDAALYLVGGRQVFGPCRYLNF